MSIKRYDPNWGGGKATPVRKEMQRKDRIKHTPKPPAPAASTQDDK